MNDWDTFISAVPWFLDPDDAVEISAPRKKYGPSPAAAAFFAPLGELLAKASVTDVLVNGTRYELLAWDSADRGRLGWLCPRPTENGPHDIHDEHKELLSFFGGIVERFNEPEDTWLLNLNDALTEREAAHDGSFIQEHKWAFDDVGISLPIEPCEYYSIAREANGNTTLCHRISGRVLLFAPDHCFKHLKVLEGCPEYTLYTINGVGKFRDWVNAVAAQWLAYASKST
jgi:hypothetical protein